MPNQKITLLYDGSCPICRWEKNKLAHADHKGKLAFIDIQAHGFDPSRYGTTMKALMGSLHAVTDDGRMLIGFDTVLASYRAAGWWWLHLPLSVLPKSLAELCYQAFAARRYVISKRIGHWFDDGCADGQCKIDPPQHKR